MSALTRAVLLPAVLALALAAAPAAHALDHVAPQGFEDAGPWPGIASITDAATTNCAAAGRAASSTAHGGANLFASSCPPLTIKLSAAQAYLTLWAKTDTGGGVTIAAPSGGPSARAAGAAGEWLPLTLPVTDQPTLSQVTITPDNTSAKLFVDDLTFSTGAQPDTAITAADPPALTNRASAAFDFDSSIGRSTFSCRLDGGDAAPCTSRKTYTSLADGKHTFTVTATDAPFGHADPTPAQYSWQVDTAAPRTRVDDGPVRSTALRSATVRFSSADGDVTGSECSLDGEPFAACTSPRAYAALPLGRHALRVRATDAAGNVETTPAEIAWTVERPAGRPSTRRLDDPGTPSGASAIGPDCSAANHPDEADRDGNGLLDRCQRLPSAKLPVAAGVGARVSVIDGEVWVRQPDDGAPARDGWVPLQGAAVIPMGSLVDARQGTVELVSAAGRTQKARLGAGIVEIRQARAAAAPLELQLTTPPGVANACAGAPARTVVRTLAASATGRYRMTGAVSTASVDGRARWVVADRCDGTVTETDRGVLALHDLRGGTTASLRAGGRTLVAAPLFVSLKGRR